MTKFKTMEEFNELMERRIKISGRKISKKEIIKELSNPVLIYNNGKSVPCVLTASSGIIQGVFK